MGIINRYRQDDDEHRERVVIDQSVMQRKQKRLYLRLEELQEEVNELQTENRYLQEYIKKLEYSLEGMTVAHSMDEIIDHYRNEAATEKKSENPFAGLIGKFPTADETEADNTDDEDDDIFSKIITDYEPADNLLKNKSDGSSSGNLKDSQNSRD